MTTDPDHASDKHYIYVVSQLQDLNERTLTFQDFEYDGEMVLPIFSSVENFDKAMNGSDFETHCLGVDLRFLCSLLRGGEVFVLDGGTPNARRLTAEELPSLLEST